ncbi:MAG: 16S rRNA (guanine(527)-N(7))-methyltransferase RsmG [bacterium]
MENLISKYFTLTADQAERFRALGKLYTEWNSRINIISRKDIDHLYLHHILHSLSIAKVIRFKPATEIMDAGTGGGFPGIPLAILFPECQFTLIDSTAKKIKVVEAIAAEIGLENITPVWSRTENIASRFDFVTGRAVSDLDQFISLVRKNIRKEGFNILPNGILYLKGGVTNSEVRLIGQKGTVYALSEFFEEPYFDTKSLIHLHNF